jgi:hypothetical protein
MTVSVPQHLEALALVAHTAAALVPNPDATLPPGFGDFSATVISWLKGIAQVGGVGGLLICGLMIIFGRRNRNQMATEGVMSTLWVAGGLALASSAALIVPFFL